MGKARKTGSKSGGSEVSSTNSPALQPSADVSSSRTGTLSEWLAQERTSNIWIFGCIFLGGLLGFMMGAGFSTEVSPWRQVLGNKIRSSETYKLLTFRGEYWNDWLEKLSDWVINVERDLEAELYAKDPSHPRVFAVLREAVVREKGGYIHHDLGLLVPAPSGASRGLGMVRDTYHKCQTACLPGNAKEKLENRRARADAKAQNETYPMPNGTVYQQEEVLVRVPLNFQMTRSVALDELIGLVPGEVQRQASLHELDDAALLVLLLAHERGVGRYSRWLPYIASLPSEPQCGYSKNLRPYMHDTINALRNELSVDVEGWSDEIVKATKYADRIAEGLNRDYGAYIKSPKEFTSLGNIQWALCQVASRATAGNEKYGSLRLVPVLDLVNHDSNAGGFIELSGKERLEKGDFVDATEDDHGTFVIRSLRHGRRKPLRKGQELLANYNVPHYTPLDWFISLGFVPPERWAPWTKIDPVLPRVRRDGPFAEESIPTAQVWKEQGPSLIQQIKNHEL